MASTPVAARIKREILPFIPYPVRDMLASLPEGTLGSLTEIRLRAGRPVSLVLPDRMGFVSRCGSLVDSPGLGYVFSAAEAKKALEMVTLGSVYALEEELRSGYITLAGGHRVGLVGKMVAGRDGQPVLRDISGFNFRVAREVPGCADTVMPYCISGDVHRMLSTLIISPPGAGKTTLLRDMVRQASDGVPRVGLPGHNVAVVDERSEIASCYQGQPQNDVGARTDVLDNCPKARGIMMLIRSMSPDVIATDEIGSQEDASAVREALNAGVSVLATAHARTLDDIYLRPALKALVDTRAFERVIALGRELGPGTLAGIYDAPTGQVLLRGPVRLAAGGGASPDAGRKDVDAKAAGRITGRNCIKSCGLDDIRDLRPQAL
ncbi:MAG TPA: stage III sporulation protein AA [Firmicutes bacterium]|nr:stage III sporulation protein AA [Bacillota bacterium]